jgi:hypothetical protein
VLFNIQFISVHAKDSTPEFEAAEEQIAGEHHDGINVDKSVSGIDTNGVKVPDDVKNDNPVFVKPAVPKSLASLALRLSAASSDGDHTCWGDLVILIMPIEGPCTASPGCVCIKWYCNLSNLNSHPWVKAGNPY